VESSWDQAFSLLTDVLVICNEAATERYRKYERAGLDWLGRMIITEAVTEFAAKENIKVVIKDQFPQEKGFGLLDEKTKCAYEVRVQCKRLGEDNGKDQLVRLSNYFKMIRDQARGRLRKLTPEETASLAAILAK